MWPREVEARINGTWTKILIETAPAGIVYRVEPGERAALDGVATTARPHGRVDDYRVSAPGAKGRGGNGVGWSLVAGKQ